ncbi:hypothetical protein L2E82_00407 [Cichorium intybus]|uniref:Uncharacterized protein n=1 Tax=Cichorium intybus TaxID=13427 RepID=A0ACB9GXJ2_CICIN|nr:hypothetical protein L2E82_00407 [Cichorium intybus]
MERVHQPLLLLATFLVAFSTLIEGRTTTFRQSELRKVQPKSEGFKARYVNNPFNTDSGVRFRDKGSAKDGSTRVIGEEPALLLHFLGFPFPFPFRFGFPYLFPFPFPFGWGGFPFGWGGFPRGGYLGGYQAKLETGVKDRSRRKPFP